MIEIANARIAIYARFSSDKQNDSSVADQVYRCKAAIEKAGGNPENAVVFSDHGISGASLDRPGIQAFLAQIPLNAFDILIAEDLSRISRDTGDTDRLCKLLAYHDVRLIGVADGIDTARDGSSSRLAVGFKAMMSDFFLADLSDKTRRGLEGRARAGLATGGQPFGYRTVKRAEGGSLIEIDDEKAVVVRRIFADYAAGYSQDKIARALNAGNLPSPRANSKRRGRGWMSSAVRVILLNRRYIGILSFGEDEWRKFPNTNRRLPRARAGGPLVETVREDLRIVDQDTWNAVQKRFESHPKMPKRGPRTHPLSGILICANCKAPMTICGGTKKFRYYACPSAKKRGLCTIEGTVRADRIEECVFEKLSSELRAHGPEVLAIIRDEMSRIENSRDDRTAPHAGRLTQLQAQLENYLNCLGATASESIVRRVEETEKQIAETRTALATEQVAAPTTIASDEEFVERVLSLSALHKHAHADVVRQSMRNILRDGTIECTRADDGGWVVRFAAIPAAIAELEKQKTPRDFSSGVISGGISPPVVAGAGFEPTTFGL